MIAMAPSMSAAMVATCLQLVSVVVVAVPVDPGILVDSTSRTCLVMRREFKTQYESILTLCLSKDVYKCP